MYEKVVGLCGERGEEPDEEPDEEAYVVARGSVVAVDDREEEEEEDDDEVNTEIGMFSESNTDDGEKVAVADDDDATEDTEGELVSGDEPSTESSSATGAGAGELCASSAAVAIRARASASHSGVEGEESVVCGGWNGCCSVEPSLEEALCLSLSPSRCGERAGASEAAKDDTASK